MAIDGTTTLDQARTAYYANLDYDAGVGSATEFRRAANLLLELYPKSTKNKDGEYELDLAHIRKQLDRVNAFIENTQAASSSQPARKIVTWLAPRRG